MKLLIRVFVVLKYIILQCIWGDLLNLDQWDDNGVHCMECLMTFWCVVVVDIELLSFPKFPVCKPKKEETMNKKQNKKRVHLGIFELLNTRH